MRKQLTLQLYHYSGTTGKTVSYEQKESEDTYIEEIGTVYDEDQAPEDLAVPSWRMVLPSIYEKLKSEM